MTGFDITSLTSFDPAAMQRELISVMSSGMAGTQDPQRVEQRPALPTTIRRGDDQDFLSLLGDSIEKVQSLQDDTRQKVRGLALGEDVDLHDVMIAANKSEVAFNLMLEVRNKLVDAWDKLSRSVV